MSTNAVIEADLRSSMSSDPRIPHPEEIAVSAQEHAVTLRGTVGSFSQRRAAVAAARKVRGVDVVDDQLRVRLLDGTQLNDAETRGILLQALAWDTEVPAELIEADVRDGWVTLEGDVNFQFQSDAAYADAARLLGVAGITNEIRVISPWPGATDSTVNGSRKEGQ